MIKTNLATRPFYNERMVHLALMLVAVIVVAASSFNVTRVIQLSHSDTALATQASGDEGRAAELRASASRLRGTIDPRQIEFVSGEARKANDLIDRRTFSWTEVFNRFETTIPDDVRITSVRPKIDPKRGTVLTITVVARGVEDVYQFMANLETTGAFAGLFSREERVNEQGMLEAALEARYVPPAAPTRSDQ